MLRLRPHDSHTLEGFDMYKSRTGSLLALKSASDSAGAGSSESCRPNGDKLQVSPHTWQTDENLAPFFWRTILATCGRADIQLNTCVN